MITIYSAMRPFHGTIGEVQLNAIRSWIAISPKCQVVLIEDEEGTSRGATNGLDVAVVDGVRRSGMGAPLLDDVLRVGRENAQHEILAFITADVLLPPGFPEAVSNMRRAIGPREFFAIGARIDLSEPVKFDFGRPDYFCAVHDAIARHGRPHGHTALDLWVYPATLDFQAPPMPIGRGGMDGWAVWSLKRRGVQVIDFTHDVTLVHQHHERPARRNPRYLDEFRECLRLFESMPENAMSLLDADWLLIDGKLRRPTGLRRLHAAMSFFRPYRYLVGRRRRFNLPELYGPAAPGVRSA